MEVKVEMSVGCVSWGVSSVSFFWFVVGTDETHIPVGVASGLSGLAGVTTLMEVEERRLHW
jgi:hypothetical protein